MIHVVAEMEIKPGCMEKILAVLKKNLPVVKAEKGCLRYEPCFRLDDEGHRKYLYILESWESEEHLKTHLGAPHMMQWREDVKDLRLSSNVRKLSPAEF